VAEHLAFDPGSPGHPRKPRVSGWNASVSLAGQGRNALYPLTGTRKPKTPSAV